MKHISLFSCTLFTVITLQCMEQTNQLELIKKIDCKKIELTLQNNYTTYLRTHLENYKTIDYTPEKMWDLRNMSQFMTGGGQYFPYNGVRDEQGNSFIRIAVKKMDVPIVDWHVTKSGAHCISQEDLDYCIKLCIEQLHPKNSVNDSQKSSAYDILKIITIKQGDRASVFTLYQKTSRERLIKQLILLKLKHKKHQSPFIIEDELITQHLTSGAEQSTPIVLAHLYQTVSNKKGNTLSHILVELQKADELHQFVTHDYISPSSNKAGKTVVDLALQHFQMFTQDPSHFDLYPDKAAQARCCLFMLLKYIKSKQSGQLSNEYTCCDKHVIII